MFGPEWNQDFLNQQSVDVCYCAVHEQTLRFQIADQMCLIFKKVSTLCLNYSKGAFNNKGRQDEVGRWSKKDYFCPHLG